MPRCIVCGDDAGKESWRKYCSRCYKRMKQKQEDERVERAFQHGVRSGAVTLSADFLKEVVMLCHPDRHPPERFELANRVTAELLRLRKAAV